MENNQITDSIEEARRYVANAEETIKKAKYDSELKSYTDSKYIKAAVAKRDKKLLNSVSIGYETMHLYMGYDGNRSKKVCDAGFELANDIIDHCATMMPKTVRA